MKKILLLTKLFVLAAVVSVNAQINFDELEMPTYKNGSNGAGQFTSGEATFVNYYNATYGSWAGFAVSKASDVSTSGIVNQYSSIVGAGAGDENYMVGYISSYSGTTYIKLASAQSVNAVSVTNSTYAHNSMRDGDAYAKQFGGDTGNDPDYFLLSVKGYIMGAYTDSTGYYLADYRFADNSQDYIVDMWQTMDLSSLGTVDSLVFELTSSDNGSWGMNTPAYFCLDDLMMSSGYQSFSEYDFDYWNGEDLTGNFMNGDGEFGNTFTPSVYGGYWTGFSYSRKTDNVTSGYTNQYSAITGAGYNGSENYAVGNGRPWLRLDYPAYVTSIMITNSTYAHNSMRDGDMFAKKFGGDSGDDPDAFVLYIMGYLDGVYIDSVGFYLADFTDANNANDYIVNTWESVDLTSLGALDSLTFSLYSTDNGDWGMNTPAYFCMDDITLSAVGVQNVNASNISVFPNPANDFIVVKAEQISDITITDLSGKIVYQNKLNNSRINIDLTAFESGVYIVSVKDNKSVYTQKFIKE